MRRVAGALVGSAVIAVLATWPFAARLGEALPGGSLSGGSQRAFWLPWQIYANVVSGRGLDDSSGFLAAREDGLFALVGRPGAALLLAPLHALGDPVLAHNAGLYLLVLTNALGAWALGETLRPRRCGLLAAALVGGAGWLAWQLGAGALAAAWVGPGLAALAAMRARRPGLFAAAALIGMVGAPAVTGAALLSGVVLPRAPGAKPTAGAGLLALFLAWILPPALGGAAVALPPNVLAWPASGVAPGFPLVFALGVGALWRARRTRVAAGLAVAAALFALGPVARDGAGEPVRVAGFALPLGPDLSALAHLDHALLTGALLVALLGALGYAARVRFGPVAQLALAALALVEPRAQRALGQPVALATGETWRVPAGLRALAEKPYSGEILQLPLLEVDEGLVGMVPFHRQVVSGAPGQQLDGPAREALLHAIATDPSVSAVSRLDEDGVDVSSIRPAVLRAGFDWVLVVGDDPEVRIGAQRALGRPDWRTELFVLWDLAPKNPNGLTGAAEGGAPGGGHGGPGAGGPGIRGPGAGAPGGAPGTGGPGGSGMGGPGGPNLGGAFGGIGAEKAPAAGAGAPPPGRPGAASAPPVGGTP